MQTTCYSYFLEARICKVASTLGYVGAELGGLGCRVQGCRVYFRSASESEHINASRATLNENPDP